MSKKNNYFQFIVAFSAVSILLATFFSGSFTSQAANDSSARVDKYPKKKLSADVRAAEFRAEKFADGVNISWRTNFEKDILGFRVWRENGGGNFFVSEDLIGGSLVKTANGTLETGGEYSIFDRNGAASDVYRVEAVSANGKSVWFDRFVVKSETNVNFFNAEIPTSGRFGQINRVDFPLKDVKNTSSAQFAESFAVVAHDASAIKLNVKNSGLYRVEPSDLAQFGISREAAKNLKLFADGNEQPLLINADGSLEFYGRGLDTFYADARVYWLTAASGFGKNIVRQAQKYDNSAEVGWSRTIAEKKDRVLRAPGILNGERENWYAGYVYSVALDQTINLSEIATESGETATLSVDLQGTGGVPHRVSVSVNGAAIGQIEFNYTDRAEWSMELPLSVLNEGANTISLRSPSSSDLSFLEAVRISYPRRFKAENNRLDFGLRSGQRAKLRGFSAPNVRVLDITNHENVKEIVPESRLETDGTYSVTLDSAPTARILLTQGENAALYSANPLTANTPSDLRSTINQAKFVIIANAEAAPRLENLKNRRTFEGLQTEIINVQDIYDEFNHGVKSAWAIRDFLRYAKESWLVKPEYVLIAGDASVDPRNYSGLGGNAKDIIPTMFTDTWNLEAVADEMLVDFDEDSIGEIAIGRLPYQTLEQLDAMINKINAVEPMSLTEINARGVTFISDAPQGYDFAAASRNIASPLPASVVPNYIDRGSQDSTVVKNAILARINSGAIIVNYFGHGQVNNWNGNTLRNTDAPLMQNAQRPTLMAMVACLNGAFAETNLESLAEAVMKTPTGGAFAVWSASASNTADEQEHLAREYQRRIFSGMRLGDAAREAKITTYMIDIRRTYIFFGDPTQRLVAP